VVLNAHPSGVMLPLPGTAGGAISASASPGGAAMQGRGLDAYRARPVMILASRTIFVH
jgi:hypothetical protein